MDGEENRTHKPVDIDKTRQELRVNFARWGIDPSEFEIFYDEIRIEGGGVERKPGANVRFLRQRKWQSISCSGFQTRSLNLRQCLFLIERLRIAEQHGVRYEGLSFTKEIVSSAGTSERDRNQDLLEAYDFLGVKVDDPLALVQEVYLKKSTFYHPDKPGGSGEKFKRLTVAYELIKKSRGS
jgi:hypothetical protein